MKKYLLFVILFWSIDAYSQKVMLRRSKTTVGQAKIHLNPSSIQYNPEKAAKLFQAAADEGDLEAMNAIAVMYGEGNGIKKNLEKSAYWFQKAAEGGYMSAWFNLGVIYKHGLGNIPLDFNKAFKCFQKATAANVIEAQYYMGYMLFKGLGCQQDYEEAVNKFKGVVHKGSSASMYMLGICYRNGYGIAKNIDSARFWLNKSARMGYKFAISELLIATPENTGNSVLKVAGAKVDLTNNKEADVIASAKIPTDEILGSYSGSLTRYDWSGKAIIGKSKLRLELKGGGGQFYGVWTEDNVSAVVTATLMGSRLVFDNTSYKLNDHYSPVEKKTFQFRDFVINLSKSQNKVSLSGKLQLWSVERAEPEKPINISLEKDKTGSEEEKIISNVLTYPNPFQQNLNIDFLLKDKLDVQISLYEVSTGKLVHSLPKETLPSGKYTRSLNLNLALGYYALKITYGSMIYSTVVYRN